MEYNTITIGISAPDSLRSVYELVDIQIYKLA